MIKYVILVDWGSMGALYRLAIFISFLVTGSLACNQNYKLAPVQVSASSPTFTSSPTKTFSPTATHTLTNSPTATIPTKTATNTSTPFYTSTCTNTPTLTGTFTNTPTITPTPVFTWCSPGHTSGIVGEPNWPTASQLNSNLNDTFAIGAFIQSPVTITNLHYMTVTGMFYRMGIYDNDPATSYPTTLMAAVTVSTGSAPSYAWVSVPIGPLFISAPQTIWLGIGADAGATLFSFPDCNEGPVPIVTPCMSGWDGEGYLPNPWNWGTYSPGHTLWVPPCMYVDWVCP